MTKILKNDQYIDNGGIESKAGFISNGFPFYHYQSPETEEQFQRECDILKWNGIYVETGKKRVKRAYRFYLCQYDVLGLYATGTHLNDNQPWLKQNKGKKIHWRRMDNIDGREIKKALRVAILSLYNLGYDLGVVDIAISDQNPRYRLINISPFQSLPDDVEQKLMNLMDTKHVNQEQKEARDAILGTDIEFVLRYDNGKYAIASNYFPRRGQVGHDAIWLKGKRNKYPIGELRPSPSRDPKTLFKNIYKCLKKGVRLVNNDKIEWLAGGNPLQAYPIGGHIHFSRVRLEASFIRALDNYLTLPLFLLESDTSLKRRPKYGFLGDYREQFHGGFEYRTPPSWIVTPKIAYGVLCLSKLISTHYHELTWMPLNIYHVQKAFYFGNREEIRSIVYRLWKELQKLSTYQNYKKELDQFFRYIEQGYQWNEYADIRESWLLTPYRR